MNGHLSNRLYALDEINRRERAAADRRFRLVISGLCVLGMSCIVIALLGGWS